jgi:hypothetical protein
MKAAISAELKKNSGGIFHCFMIGQRQRRRDVPAPAAGSSIDECSTRFMPFINFSLTKADQAFGCRFATAPEDRAGSRKKKPTVSRPSAFSLVRTFLALPDHIGCDISWRDCRDLRDPCGQTAVSSRFPVPLPAERRRCPLADGASHPLR